MAALIFATRADYDAFEAKMAARSGIPKAGRSASTGEIVDPDRKTGKGWTTRFTDPVDERAGVRVMAHVKDGAALDASDTALIKTSKVEIDKFGELPVK